MYNIMAEHDANKEALDQVEKATDSGPVRGDELLESEKLKRQLREAKERLKSEATLPKDGREDQKS
jgi:transcriptional regulator of met regulon